MLLLRSPDIFYIKVLNIFIYVNFFFSFSISRGIPFAAPEGGRVNVLSLRPLFPDEEVGASGGQRDSLRSLLLFTGSDFPLEGTGMSWDPAGL